MQSTQIRSSNIPERTVPPPPPLGMTHLTMESAEFIKTPTALPLAGRLTLLVTSHSPETRISFTIEREKRWGGRGGGAVISKQSHIADEIFLTEVVKTSNSPQQ